MPGSIGPGELIIVLVIALIILGPKKLPEVGRSVGRGMREFKDSLAGINLDDDDDDDDERDRKPVRQTAGKELLEALEELESAGLELGANYHSHTRSAPIPSQTDVNLAKWWPEPLWMIVGLENDEADVRAWKIVDGTVSEAALEVEDGAGIDV
jgi:TatA/E family protein of Tat protein translocase